MSGISLSNITTPSTGISITGGAIKTGTFTSLYFKTLTATNAAAIAVNGNANLTLSGFDSNFTTAASGTAVNVPPGIYTVVYYSSQQHPIQSSSITFTQNIVNVTGTGSVCPVNGLTQYYAPNQPTSSNSGVADNCNFVTQVYLPTAGTLQFNFGNYLGASLAANAVTATICISAQRLF